MLSLPLVAPRDSHELWFGSYRSPSYTLNNNGADSAARRQLHNGHAHNNHNSHGHNGGAGQQPYAPSTRALLSSATPSDSLALLQLEERALRLRKENIASFGCAWIKPAGCAKTMLGMREEEAEREEGLAAATQELNMAAMVAATGGMTGGDAFGDPSQQQQQMMAGEGNVEDVAGGGEGDGIGVDELERDLDDDIPEADDGFGDMDDEDGLVEEGEEGYEEDDDVEEDLMERNLDDDIPEVFPEDDEDDEDDEDEDEDEQEYENDEGLGGSIMVHDLDEDIPEADDIEDEDMDDDEERVEGEWQHTDSELEDNDDSDLDDDDDNTHDPYAEHIAGVDSGVSANTQTPGSANTNTAASARRRRQRDSTHLPPPPSTNTRQTRETEAQRRFLQRWSGGGMESDLDAFDTSAITIDDEDEDLRASITGRARGYQAGRPRQSQGRFSRFMRRGGPRDSLD